jgi:hypothetical protein
MSHRMDYSDFTRIMAQIGRAGCKCRTLMAGPAICPIHELVYQATAAVNSMVDQVLKAIADPASVDEPSEKECMEEFEP